MLILQYGKRSITLVCEKCGVDVAVVTMWTDLPATIDTYSSADFLIKGFNHKLECDPEFSKVLKNKDREINDYI